MRCSGAPWVALLVVACGTPEAPSALAPEPDPLRYRYDLGSDRWAPAPTEVGEGVYWHAPPGMFGVGMGSVERVGEELGRDTLGMLVRVGHMGELDEGLALVAGGEDGGA